MDNYSASIDPDDLSVELKDRSKYSANDKAFGIRDALLVKCRDTIESLNQELEDEKRSKKQLENQIQDLEHSQTILEHKLRSQEILIIELKEELDSSQNETEHYKLELKKFSALKPLQEAQVHMTNTVRSLEHSLNVLQEENSKLKAQLESEKLKSRESIDSRKSVEYEKVDLEKFEYELEELYEKKYKSMIKEFEKKQEMLKDELNNAIDKIEVERQRYQEMYKSTVDENNELRQEIKYLQNMLQRKQSQLEKHSQQSLDQLQNILEKKNYEQAEGYKRLVAELEKEKIGLEREKSELEDEVFRLKDQIDSMSEFQKNYENLNSEHFVLKANILELEQKVQTQKSEKKKMNKNIEDLRKVLLENEPDSTQENRKIELVKIKYQALLQSEMQKRLKDKQSYKEHLIQDKEAFLSKLRAKDEKIAKLESEKTELIYKLNYIQNQKLDDSDRRIVNADTVRVIFI